MLVPRWGGFSPLGKCWDSPALPNCNCKPVKQCAGPCQESQARTAEGTRESWGCHMGTEEKKQGCRSWGNRWQWLRNIAAFTLGLIPQTYTKIHQKPIAPYALKSSKLGNLMSCLKSIYFSFILPANTLNTQCSKTQAFQNLHLFSRHVISPTSKLGPGQCSLDKEVNKPLKQP